MLLLFLLLQELLMTHYGCQTAEPISGQTPDLFHRALPAEQKHQPGHQQGPVLLLGELLPAVAAHQHGSNAAAMLTDSAAVHV
jgi:hypothetical protein